MQSTRICLLLLVFLNYHVYVKGELCPGDILNTAYNGEVEVIREMIENKKTNLNCTAQRDEPLIIFAGRTRSWDVVRLLVSLGADINTEDRRGITLMEIALENSDIEGVDWLQSKGVECRNALNTLLCHRIYRAIDQIPSLKNSTCCADGRDKYNNTALFLFAKAKESDFPKIAEQVCSINVTDLHGNSILHVLASMGSYHQLMWLLQNQNSDKINSSIDINIRDSNGNTALQIGAARGDWELVHGLLGHNADINAKDMYGNTVLHLAATKGKWTEVSKLVGKGANINAEDMHHNTVLHMAADGKEWSAVHQLVREGADVNIKNMHGNTALHVIAANKQCKHVKELINNNKGDQDAKDMRGVSVSDMLKNCGTTV